MTHAESSLATYLAEHVRSGGPFGDGIGMEKATALVVEIDGDDTYVALIKDTNGVMSAVGIGSSKNDVLDIGSDLLYGGELPTAVLHYTTDAGWDEVDITLTLAIA
jgi:hypothetical protein